MASFLKYLGAFCLLTVAASLAFCSVTAYQSMQTVNRLLAGADNYTCRQFLYDLKHADTDKFAPLAIATIAYGAGDASLTEIRQTEIIENGMRPAVQKVYALCEGNPAERVLNVFTQTLVSPTTPGVSTTIAPVPASTTLNTKN